MIAWCRRMPLKIDLKSYREELEAVSRMVTPFLEPDGVRLLKQVVAELSNPVLAGLPVIDWATPQDEPIRFKTSTKYDGVGKVMPAMRMTLGFFCRFSRPQNSSKRGAGSEFWEVKRSETHLRWCDDAGAEKMACHFDLKNGTQRGPEYHFQLADGRVRPAIPRMPMACFLPTDCLDLALCELCPEEWPLRQSNMNHERQILVKAQRARMAHSAADVVRHWSEKSPAQSPISAMQSYESKRPFILKSHKS